MRSSSIPLLQNEPLVVVRASFLRLCDGDHCAAVLLNNFVYWHDWCVTHGRYDVTASAADPDHQPADPERWFWKTTEGLVNDDLLRLWGEKKVRAAIDLLEAKRYAQSRFNPKNRYDRTKQYRLVPERLTADLQQWRKIQDERSADASPEGPDASGKNTECALSISCETPSTRQKRRIETAQTPDLLTETTEPEITEAGISSSSSPSARPTPGGGRKTEVGSPTGAMIDRWAADRHIRRRRDDQSYGGPDPHWCATWGQYCEERGIHDPGTVFQVMDRAKSMADRREQWRFWKYLDEQVQLAVERCSAGRQDQVRAFSAPDTPRPVEDPDSEWARVKSQLKSRLNPVAYANWIEQTCQLRREGSTVLVWLPDHPTRDWIEQEYSTLITEALCSIGPFTVNYTDDAN